MAREWYPWQPRLFWGSESVARLDDAAIALYKFLLDHEWDHGPFTADEAVLRVICARFRSFESSWPQVRQCFKQDEAGRLYHPRMETERAIEREGSAARAERSKNSWTKRRHAAEDALAVQAQSTRRAHAEQVQSTQPATDGRTDGRTNVPTDLQTEGAAEGRKRPPSKTLELSSLPLPQHLDRPDVRAALAEYQAVRAENKHSPVKETGWKQRLRELSALTPEQAIRALAYSGPHQGFYVPKDISAPHNGKPFQHAFEKTGAAIDEVFGKLRERERTVDVTVVKPKELS